MFALLGYTQENGDLYLEKAQHFLDKENDSVLVYSKKAKNIFSKKTIRLVL